MRNRLVPSQATLDARLDAAVKNGYKDEVMGAPRDVAVDLITSSSDCEGATVDELAPLVEDWQKREKRKAIQT